MKADKTRRAFLQKLTAVGAAAFGGASVLSGCGGKDTASSEPAAPAAPAQTAGGECSDFTGLTDQEISVRTVLGYVEVGPDPEKLCTGCHLYSQAEGSNCGACTLMKGPIAPKGTCNSWVVKQEA